MDATFLLHSSSFLFFFPLALLFSRRRDAPPSTKSNRDEEKNEFFLPFSFFPDFRKRFSNVLPKKQNTLYNKKEYIVATFANFFDDRFSLIFLSLSFLLFPPSPFNRPSVYTHFSIQSFWSWFKKMAANWNNRDWKNSRNQEEIDNKRS